MKKVILLSICLTFIASLAYGATITNLVPSDYCDQIKNRGDQLCVGSYYGGTTESAAQATESHGEATSDSGSSEGSDNGGNCDSGPGWGGHGGFGHGGWGHGGHGGWGHGHGGHGPK